MKVRRMVAVMLAVAENRLSLQEVYEMLTIPSHKYWPKFVGTAPAHPLFLCKIEMKPAEEINESICRE